MQMGVIGPQTCTLLLNKQNIVKKTYKQLKIYLKKLKTQIAHIHKKYMMPK